MLERPRRNRVNAGVRGLVRETSLAASHLVWPSFVQEGQGRETPIASMPGQSRLSVDLLVERARAAHDVGVPAIALFPALDDSLKDPRGKESTNPGGLLQRAVAALKQGVPDLVIITDVALDPYSSDGHDGVVIDGLIDNAATVPILTKMAVAQARAGADVVAPSDMMDGRVLAIRTALDEAGFANVGICSYSVKSASAFYGPFREALDSAPKSGDKKTYQMDPANVREALREVRLDEAEGADWLMVKPGLPYLDVLRFVREHTNLPVATYHVSGEYAMLKAAARNGWLDYDRCLLESLMSLRRAGADIDFHVRGHRSGEVARVACRRKSRHARPLDESIRFDADEERDATEPQPDEKHGDGSKAPVKGGIGRERSRVEGERTRRERADEDRCRRARPNRRLRMRVSHGNAKERRDEQPDRADSGHGRQYRRRQFSSAFYPRPHERQRIVRDRDDHPTNRTEQRQESDDPRKRDEPLADPRPSRRSERGLEHGHRVLEGGSGNPERAGEKHGRRPLTGAPRDVPIDDLPNVARRDVERRRNQPEGLGLAAQHVRDDDADETHEWNAREEQRKGHRARVTERVSRPQ